MTAIEQQIGAVVDSILEDYRHQRDIDHLDIHRHPDKSVIVDLIPKLLRLIYPGYSQDHAYRYYNAKHNLSLLTEDIMFHMSEQIALVLGGEENRETAQQLTLSFLRQIPALRALAQSDVEAAYDGDPAATSIDEIIFCYPGLFAITVYRLAHVLYCQNVPMIPRIMTEHAHSITGIDIHPGASIGERFFIDHGTGVVIGETTVIGKRVKLYQGVTLGGLSTRGGQTLRGKKRHPTIEDDVTIYANAAVLGGETVIGHSSVIGASAFITESVPSCTTVTPKANAPEYRARRCPGCDK